MSEELGGSTGQPASGGATGTPPVAGGAAAATVNGGASAYGRLVRGVLPEHDHETPSTGGELDAYLTDDWGAAHLAAADPHAGYATDADLAAALGPYATDADLAAHAAAADPHPTYVTAAEGAADFAASDHDHPWPTAAREYQFATNTNVDVDPGNGYLRSNTGNAVTATRYSIDRLTQNNFDIDVILGALRAGDIMFIQDKDNGANWVRFELSAAPTAMGGWWRLDGAPVAGAGAIATAQLVACVFYLEKGTGGEVDAVTSVNGETGDVVLSADDVGALDAADLAAHTALPDAHHARDHNHTAADGSGVLSNEEHDGYSQYANLGADPATPATNRIRLYSKDNGSGVATLYYITENGTIYEMPTLTTGGGGGSGAPSNATYVTLTSESKLSQETLLGAGVVMTGTLAGRPAPGTAGRLYHASDAGLVYRDTGGAWAAFAVAPTLADAKGDVLVASAADTLGRLAVGANGQVLTADSSETLGVKWATPATGLATDPLADAKGDVFVASGADAVARLAVGSDGHVLTADSSETLGVKWAAAGGGGGGGGLPTTGGTMTGTITADGADVDSGGALRVVGPGEAAADARVYGAGGAAFSPAAGGLASDELGVAFSVSTACVLVAVRWYRMTTGQTTPGAVRLWDSTSTGAAVWSTTTPTAWADTAVGWKEHRLTGGTEPVLVAGRTYAVAYAGGGANTNSVQAGYTPVPDAPVTFLNHVLNGTVGLYPASTGTTAWGVDLAVRPLVGAATPAASGAVRLPNGTAGALGWRNGSDSADLSLTMDPSNRLALVVGATALTTSATAGAASALPATPTGYLTVVLNTQTVKIPYYS